LSFSRFANQAVVLLSPLLLVRILSVGEFGSYREFMLYVAFIGPLVTFGVARSLPYLLPKYPEQERIWVTQTVLFILATSTIAITAIFLLGNLIRTNTSFDFVTALQLYIFFSINLDFIELYWLGKKRTDYVLYYSSGRLLARTVVVIIAAFLSQDALTIVYSLVVLETLRCLIVLWYSNYRRWFTSKITRASLSRQASYFLPLGSGAIVETLNANAGSLFVSTMIGAEALAFYAIGMFATPVVDILRGAIADVIFPDIVEIRSADPKDALPLWRRATVWYCFLLFPAAILFSYYADAIVTVLFTDQYAAAIPVFAVFALLIYLYCFDFHLPLRVQNANRYFVVGNIIALVVNVSLLFPMYRLFGLVGPAIGFVTSRLMLTLYLASRTSRVYQVGVYELVLWRDVGKVFVASILLVDNLLLRGLLFGSAYMAVYLFALQILGLSEAPAMVRALLGSKPWRKRVGNSDA
jgi:O-antigen/teichoic acid export membrane protein